jgi:hypothetical protein
MKNISAISSIIFFSVLLCACKKDAPITPQEEEHIPIYTPCDTTQGVATAYKATRAWKSGATCRSYWSLGKKYWLIELTTCTSTNGFMRENLIFGGMPDDSPQQEFNISLPASILPEGAIGAPYGTLSDDGDVLEDYYNIDTSATDNYFTVDIWDTVNKRAEGRFYVTFLIDEPRLNPKNPKKVTFSAGHFWVKIPD